MTGRTTAAELRIYSSSGPSSEGRRAAGVHGERGMPTAGGFVVVAGGGGDVCVIWGDPVGFPVSFLGGEKVRSCCGGRRAPPLAPARRATYSRGGNVRGGTTRAVVAT
jgi:hypothetical protein